MTGKLKQFYYKKSRLQQLRGFCYTVQLGSVTKASKHMGLGTTAVTLQIQTLEKDLKVKLFERAGNRLSITKKGKAFYDLAIVQLQGVDGLFETFYTQMNEKNKNTLIIASCNSALSYILPEYIKRLTEQKRFRNIQINLCNIPGEEALKRLIVGEIDFAFYPLQENSRNISVEIKEEKIFKSKYALFLNKSHPLAKKSEITKEDVKKYKYLRVVDQYTAYDPVENLHFKKSKIHFENGNSNIVMGLVRKNIEIGAGNELWKSTNSDIVFKNIDHLLPKTFYSIFTLKNKQQKESASYLINELRKDKEGGV
ncbi:LysR family transcriptional regulator [Pseudomonadota bacterium]